jgi:glycosyltransferase involved in cell wall biosynthesis
MVCATQGGGTVTAPAAFSKDNPPSVEMSAKGRARRLLLVSSHVVQYASPIFRGMAKDPRFDILVAYCSMQGAESGIDPGFGVEVTWDQPQLDGYSWVHPRNRALRPGVDRFFGLVNPGLWKLIRDGNFDAMYVSGYFYASAWIAILAARRHGVPIIFSTDAHNLRTWGTQSRWKQRVKKFLVRRIYLLGEVVLAGSSGTIEYLKALGVSPHRILLGRNVVDNSWWTRQAAEADPNGAREAWKIPVSASVALFCAKLQPWKAPLDVLEAFARADVPNSFLVYAGDGPLRGSVEQCARGFGIWERIRILGFVNQSQLPSVYRGADLFVLPSWYEPFGLVVNEAMLCGCPVAVSDHVGAKYDLVREGENGFVFPTGNVDALAEIFRNFLPHPERLRSMGEAARRRMETWSPREYVNAMSEAVELAGRSRGRGISKNDNERMPKTNAGFSR